VLYLEIYTVDFDLKVLKIEDKDPEIDGKDKSDKENIYKKLLKVKFANFSIIRELRRKNIMKMLFLERLMYGMIILKLILILI
jgi:hypothetical protein